MSDGSPEPPEAVPLGLHRGRQSRPARSQAVLDAPPRHTRPVDVHLGEPAGLGAPIF